MDDLYIKCLKRPFVSLLEECREVGIIQLQQIQIQVRLVVAMEDFILLFSLKNESIVVSNYYSYSISILTL